MQRLHRKTSDQYHHGALREALVLATERYIAKHGTIDVSVRELAATAGVSHAAAYRHFSSKTALLAEVARRGFGQLEQRLREVELHTRRSAEHRLLDACVAYVAFAMEHQGAFRVMFDAALKPFTAHEGLSEASLQALAVLQKLIHEGMRAEELRRIEPRRAVMSVWSLVHGHATLLLDEQLGLFGAAQPDSATSTRAVVECLLEGLRAR